MGRMVQQSKARSEAKYVVSERQNMKSLRLVRRLIVLVHKGMTTRT